MDIFAFPKLNGEPITHSIDLAYEGNTVVISLYPLDMPMVERLLNAGLDDEFGITIGTSQSVLSLGNVQHAKLTKVDSALDEVTQLEITITLSKFEVSSPSKVMASIGKPYPFAPIEWDE